MKILQETYGRLDRLLERIVKFFKQRYCKHHFYAPEMGRRDEYGILIWPCHKCGKVHKFEYGLQANDHGYVTGPWGT